MNNTRTYRGSSIEELLPQIRAELGPGAVIIRRREGVTGGIGGFFGRRLVEVEARDNGPQPTPVIDAYDAGGEIRIGDPADPMTQHLVRQVAPFADALDGAADRLQAIAAEPDAPFELHPDLAAPAPASEPSSDEWVEACHHLMQLGMPEPVAAMLSRDAERTMAPFDPSAGTHDLLRKAIARHVRIDHGWRTKRRTIAVVGGPGAGKTATVAKLCHAYATRSSMPVRTLSLEPASSAYRLGRLTEHLDLGIRVADTPDAAARAAEMMPGDGLTVVDTPAVTIGDPDGIHELAALLAAVEPDETHLAVPAANDARATTALYAALTAELRVHRLVITRVDEVESAAAAIGSSFTHKRPISYVTDSRRATDGLRPAEPMAIAEAALPR